MQEMGYSGESRAEIPDSRQGDNPETNTSRKPPPHLGQSEEANSEGQTGAGGDSTVASDVARDR